jgi:hypothetical protein
VRGDGLDRTIGIAGLLLLLTLLPACKHAGGSTTSGTAAAQDDRPAATGLSRSERREVRNDVDRRLHVLSVAEEQDRLGAASAERLDAAMRLLDSLEGLGANGASPRDQERIALQLYADYLRLAVASELTPVPDISEEMGADGAWARAVDHYLDEDAEAALHEGLTALRELTDAQLDSPSLRVRLGEWALEAGDHELALRLFESAVAAGVAEQSWAEEAGRRADEARAATLGPDAVALVQANGLIDAGELSAAHDRLQELLATGTDEDVLADGRELLELLLADAEDSAVESLARAGAILEGPGPYDDVQALLASVQRLPAGSFDKAELLRLQGWYRARSGAEDQATAAARRAALDATLGDARDLVVAGAYRPALLAYAKLDGTEHQSTARREAREAAETLVREERERAGKLFVAARKQSDRRRRADALEEVRAILDGLLSEFPDSQYAERLSTNLAAVQREIAALPPG